MRPASEEMPAEAVLPSLLLLIPAYNEGDAVVPHLRRMIEAVSLDCEILVVVDTEEEFDWSAAPPTSAAVTAMHWVDRGQKVFDRFGLKPTYVIDYPVATQPGGFERLVEIAGSGRCTIGAHPHPWVNPPVEEELSGRNTFMCNLPVALQREKLRRLCDAIGNRFGKRPTTYKAGRYGLGPSTVPVLKELGFRVDVSVCPRYSFVGEDGPSFEDFDAQPFFLDDQLLELPCTVDFVGWAGSLRGG